MKKLLSELPMLGLGIGGALAGVSLAVIGLSGIRKNFYGCTLLMGGGALAAHVGSQVALGTIERIRGIR